LTLEQQERAMKELQAEKQLELNKLKEQLINDPQRRLDAMQDLCPGYDANLLAKQKVYERLLAWDKKDHAWRREGMEQGWRLDSKMADFFKSQKHREWELRGNDSRDEKRLLDELKTRADHKAEKDREACARVPASICAAEPAYKKLLQELELIVHKRFEIQNNIREIAISKELTRDRGLELER
jgi:hypothetical protein